VRLCNLGEVDTRLFDTACQTMLLCIHVLWKDAGQSWQKRGVLLSLSGTPVPNKRRFY
jgi:hypothetical protein